MPASAIAVSDRKVEKLSNVQLVRACLRGDEEAWSKLVDRYKNLVFSIPIKYGFSRDEAADIFQAVCLELLSELPKLRKPEALPKWIMQITAHKCFHRRQEQKRAEPADTSGSNGEHAEVEDHEPGVDAVLRQAEAEQILRQAVAELSPRCRQLVEMLFYEEPAREYREIARTLGIATGSIGFIRQRCLESLRRRLSERDF
jgi:RNA polymerase sigma factor (sigma-70 family)